MSAHNIVGLVEHKVITMFATRLALIPDAIESIGAGGGVGVRLRLLIGINGVQSFRVDSRIVPCHLQCDQVVFHVHIVVSSNSTREDDTAAAAAAAGASVSIFFGHQCAPGLGISNAHGHITLLTHVAGFGADCPNEMLLISLEVRLCIGNCWWFAAKFYKNQNTKLDQLGVEQQ